MFPVRRLRNRERPVGPANARGFLLFRSGLGRFSPRVGNPDVEPGKREVDAVLAKHPVERLEIRKKLQDDEAVDLTVQTDDLVEQVLLAVLAVLPGGIFNFADFTEDARASGMEWTS